MSHINVIVEPPDASLLEIGGDASATVEAFAHRAPELAEGLVEIAEQLGAKLDELGTRRDAGGSRTKDRKVELSFGLGFEAGAGLLIVRGSTSATFGVKITWDDRPPGEAPARPR